MSGFARVLDTQYVVRDANLLTDEELFRQIAAAMDDNLDTSSGKVGVQNPQENPEPISRFASLWNEAIRRGFQNDDIGIGMRGQLRASPKLSPFLREPSWQSFEKLVARIHIAYCRDAQVKWSEKLVDRSGTERQIDVTVRSKVGPHPVLGIISCKHKKRPVPISEVEAFITSKQDLNAAIAIMVSSSGYQEGALAKAKMYGLQLWTLQQAETAAWRNEIRVYKLLYPIFSELRFDPILPADAIPQGNRIELNEITFVTPDQKQYSLQNLSAMAIDQASQMCVPIPNWVNLELPAGSTMHFRDRAFPIQRVGFYFSRTVTLQQRKNMNIPTGASYNFNEAPDGSRYTIAERDLPALKDKY